MLINDNYFCRLPRTGLAGSSPLARGTRRGLDHRRERVRFIPARAGNTCSSASGRRPITVHPRSRGEHFAADGVRERLTGSSPLARGTRPLTASRIARVRFIPARAGNTSPRSRGTGASTVHPRSRGEHSSRSTSTVDSNGSSPLARGTPRPAGSRRRRSRFIPARAGNTPIRKRCCSISTVHPRSRGEHPAGETVRIYLRGSSPLARGTLFPQGIDSKGVSERRKLHQLWSPDSGEKATARSRRVAPTLWLVHRRSVAAKNARA